MTIGFGTPDPFNPFTIPHYLNLYSGPGHDVMANGLNIFYQRFLKGRVIWTDTVQLTPQAYWGFDRASRYTLSRPTMFVVPGEPELSVITKSRTIQLNQSNVGSMRLLVLEPDPVFRLRNTFFTMPSSLGYKDDFGLRDPGLRGGGRTLGLQQMMTNPDLVLVPTTDYQMFGQAPEYLMIGPPAPPELMLLAEYITEALNETRYPLAASVLLDTYLDRCSTAESDRTLQGMRQAEYYRSLTGL